jgi:hypothetical protein
LSQETSPADAFESNLLHGGSRLIADLTEFFRDYKVDDTIFTIYAKGNTRNKGLFLSRFFAWTVLPNYPVSLFCVDEGKTLLSTERLRMRMDTVTKVTDRDELKWAWLVVLSDRPLSPQIVSFVSRYDRKELGLAAASTTSKQIVLSNNQVGRSIAKQLKLRKALESSKHWIS